MAVIEARGLGKMYGGKVAVNDLTFDVQPGSVTGFLGPNGAGKSTTMRLMLGLDHLACCSPGPQPHSPRSSGSRRPPWS